MTSSLMENNTYFRDMEPAEKADRIVADYEVLIPEEKLFSRFSCYLYLLRSLSADGINGKLFYFCRTGANIEEILLLLK